MATQEEIDQAKAVLESEPIQPDEVLSDVVEVVETFEMEVFDQVWVLNKSKFVLSAREKAEFQAAQGKLIKIQAMRKKGMSEKLIEKTMMKDAELISAALGREFSLGVRIAEALISEEETDRFNEVWNDWDTSTNEDNPIVNAITSWQGGDDPKS